MLSSGDDGAATAAQGLALAERDASFVRSFAYASGPAYGVLLDAAAPGWREALGPDSDLGALLARALGLDPSAAPAERQASRAARRYRGAEVRREESRREAARARQEAEDRGRFVDGPVLSLPLRSMSLEFDPNGLRPLGEIGTVYPRLRVADAWGVLDAKRGAVLARDFTKVYVAAPFDAKAAPLAGVGWTLDLEPDWSVVAGARDGDWTVDRIADSAAATRDSLDSGAFQDRFPKRSLELSTGIAMSYVEAGDPEGEVVILLHGITDTSRSFSLMTRYLTELRPDLHVFALDQRGHGDSSLPSPADCRGAPERCFRPADFAADVLAFMDQKGIRRAHLVVIPWEASSPRRSR